MRTLVQSMGEGILSHEVGVGPPRGRPYRRLHQPGTSKVSSSEKIDESGIKAFAAGTERRAALMAAYARFDIREDETKRAQRAWGWPEAQMSHQGTARGPRGARPQRRRRGRRLFPFRHAPRPSPRGGAAAAPPPRLRHMTTSIQTPD